MTTTEESEQNRLPFKMKSDFDALFETFHYSQDVYEVRTDMETVALLLRKIQENPIYSTDKARNLVGEVMTNIGVAMSTLVGILDEHILKETAEQVPQKK